MSRIHNVFILIILLFSLGKTSAQAQDLDQEDFWPMAVGWEAIFERDDGKLFSNHYLSEIRQTREGEVYEFINTRWGSSVIQTKESYLRKSDGDIYLMRMEALGSGDEYWFDPPILYLDFPLYPGKTWETHSTSFKSTEPGNMGEPEHHQFRVESVEIETPLGTFPAYKTFDDPVAGQPMGGDYYVAGLGPVAYESNNNGKTRRITHHTSLEWDPGLGWGEIVAFQFGWKPGMSWDVDRTTHIYDNLEKESNPIRGNQRYSLTAEMIPVDMIVTRGNLEIPLGLDPKTLTENEAQLIELFSRIETRLVVNKNGEFQSLGRKKKQEDSIREIAGLIENLKGSRDLERLQEFLEPIIPLLSPGVLERAAMMEWNNLIGNWAEREFVIGETGHFPFSSPAFLVFNINLILDATLIVTGRCPCDEESIDNDCVQILLTGRTAKGQDLKGISAYKTVKVIMEPDGMFPHKMTLYDSIQIKDHPIAEDKYVSTLEILRFSRGDTP